MSESKAVGYVWMELVSLWDMVQWVGEEEKWSVRARVDAMKMNDQPVDHLRLL